VWRHAPDPRGDDAPPAPAYLSEDPYEVVAPEPEPVDDALAVIAAVVRTEDDDLMAPLSSRTVPSGTPSTTSGLANVPPEPWYYGFLVAYARWTMILGLLACGLVAAGGICTIGLGVAAVIGDAPDAHAARIQVEPDTAIP
jgi:hypothetical protein